MWRRLALSGVALAGCLVACQLPGPVESSTAQDVINLLPSSYDFGSLQVGASSSPFAITVNPASGNQDDTVTAVTASCPDFSVSAPGLPAHVYRVCELDTCPTCAQNLAPTTGENVFCRTTDSAAYSFTASFHPTVAGTVSCVVAVTTSDPADSRTITLTGTGTVPPVQIDVQPTSVAFGDVRVKTDSTAASVAVHSAGGSALTVSSVAISSSFQILSGPTGTYSLAAGATQPYSVVCHPSTAGALSGQLVVSSSDPARPTVTVPLSCKGIDSNLDVTPSPAVFPTTRVGEPLDTTLTLRNSGTLALVLDGMTLQGTGITMTSAPPPGTSLAAGGTAQVKLHFDAATKGDASATLDVTYDGGKARSAQISARALATSLALTPDGNVDFGPVCSGQSKTQEFTLIANDQGSFAVTAVSAPDAPFSVSALKLPVTVLGAGASQVKIQITAAPTSVGPVTTPVVLQTDIPGAPDHTVQLGVEGLGAGVAATPAQLDLGSNPINSTTIAQVVHLSNCSTSPIGFSNPRIEGPDALDFAIVQQPTSAMISPSELASWLVVLQAHTVGVKQAMFVVDHDGGTASIALQGEGLGDAPATSSRGSYYGCSTGQPTTLWPLGAALALVLCRRRRSRA